MSWSGWYLRNSSISAILRSVIGVVTPFRWLVVLLLEGNAPVTFSVNHRPDSTGFYTLPGTLTSAGLGRRTSRLAHAHRLPLHSPRIIPQPPSDGQARHRADAGSPSLPEHVLQGNPVLLASVKLKGKSAQIPAMAGLDLGKDPLGPFLPLAERHGVEGDVIGLQDLVQGDQAVLG